MEEKTIEHSTRIALLEYGNDKLSEAVKEISESLKTIVSIEERQQTFADTVGRAFSRLEAIEGRLHEIECAMPGLIEIRKWMVVGIASLVGTAFMAIVSMGFVHGTL